MLTEVTAPAACPRCKAQFRLAVDRCLSEQLYCADYLLNRRGDEMRGVSLGLADWAMEEVLIRLEQTA